MQIRAYFMRDIAFKVHYNEEKKKNVQIKLKKKNYT